MHLCGCGERCKWLTALQGRIPHAFVVKDRVRSHWDTARRAWLAGLEDPWATHVMVLQDDWTVVPNFVSRVHALVAERPDHAISPFQCAGEDAIKYYTADRSRGWRTCGGIWGGTVCLPIDWVEPMIRECDMEPKEWVDDARINNWLARHQKPTSHFYPPLMEHVGWNSSAFPGVPAEEWRRGEPIAETEEAI